MIPTRIDWEYEEEEEEEEEEDEEEEEEEEEEKEDIIPIDPDAMPTGTQGTKGAKMSEWEDELSFLLRIALQPFESFIGMVALKSGIGDARKFYERDDPVNRGAIDESDFIVRNVHVGTKVLAFFLNAKKSQAKSQAIGACFNDGEMMLNPRDIGNDNRIRQMLEMQFNGLIPEWIYSVAGSSIFWWMTSFACQGAIIAARNKLRRLENLHNVTVEELVCSDGVNDNFATLVGQVFLSTSGGNAYPARVQQGNTVYNVSAGFKTRTALAKNMLGGQYWFKDVYRAPNPNIARYRAQFIEEPDPVVAARIQEMIDQLSPYVLKHSDF
jgi:hypothetical protein